MSKGGENRVKDEAKLATTKRKGPSRKIWLAIILLLPSLIAFVSFFLVYNNLYFSPSNIYDISLYDTEGNLMGSERNYLRDAEKDGLVLLFSPITESLTESTTIPDTADLSNRFHAVVKYMNTVKEYDFYFSADNMVGYCSFNSNFYKLAGSDTEKFLSSRFAESLYSESVAPTMYSISGDVIAPQSVSWNYKTVTGYYNTSIGGVASNDVITYDMSGALGVSFDREPDKCVVTVFRNDIPIFSGSTEEMSLITFEKGEVLKVEMIATWNYKQGISAYGNIKYYFNATVSDRAEFHLTGDTFAVDSFCGIFCTNVKDASKIRFISDPPFPITPKFELSRENAVALLPIVPEAQTGQYEITLQYGATTQSFTLTIKQRVGGITLDCAASEELVNSAFDEKTQSQVEQLKQLAAECSKGEKLFYGNFLDYRAEGIGASQYSMFGDLYVNPVKGYYSEGHEYRFERLGGNNVLALNGGNVIKTGYNEYLGNYVIVSHGCGLATWYAHLSTTDVVEGDYVVRGESLGKTGTSGLCTIENVMIFVTLDSNFINPQYLCGKQFD